MPFKANAARRHHIPKQRRRVTNWAEYDAALRQRGSLTVWFTEAAVAAWEAEPRTTPGGQPHYSDLAITTALTLKAVFRLALRQTEGLIGSIIGLLGLALSVPDHTTLSGRAETLEVPRPRSGTEPVHLLVDSTGLKLCGPGEWLIEKHGTRKRRSWRKLHIGRDADTGRIVAATLTTHDVDDGAQGGPLLDQVDGPIASFTGAGAYDQDGVYASVAERHPEAAVIVPPRSTAVPSATAETAPTQRDCHLQLIAEKGRMAWQKASGYNARARAEATIGRFKRVIGDGLRSRTDERRATEMDACWTWDARPTSASPEPRQGWGHCARIPDPCNTAAVCALNRLELLAETLRAALNAIAGVGPDWLRALAPPEWHERYDRRVEDRRLPKTEPQRDAYVAQVGADGFLLLDTIDAADAPPAIA